MLILLIGVDHHIQYLKEDYSNTYKEKILQFSGFLKKQSIEYKVDLLAEEFNEEALEINQVKTSTVLNVAKSLGILHCFCDPNSKQRALLNTSLLHDEREKFWLDKILSTRKQNVILVCGENHIDTFSDKLIENKIDFKILYREVGFGFELI